MRQLLVVVAILLVLSEPVLAGKKKYWHFCATTKTVSVPPVAANQTSWFGDMPPAVGEVFGLAHLAVQSSSRPYVATTYTVSGTIEMDRAVNCSTAGFKVGGTGKPSTWMLCAQTETVSLPPVQAGEEVQFGDMPPAAGETFGVANLTAAPAVSTTQSGTAQTTVSGTIELHKAVSCSEPGAAHLRAWHSGWTGWHIEPDEQ